ncbi:hypothetical protein ACW9UR_13340 [Halovulum sp. GXIMD14794]
MSQPRRYVPESKQIDAREPERSSVVLPFVLGLLGGLVLGGVLLAYPDALGRASAQIVGLSDQIDEDRRRWVVWALGLGLVFIVFMLRNQILRSGALLGIVLGLFLWLPFGRQIVAYTPGLDRQVPTLAGGLDRFVARSPAYGTVRGWGESVFPVPGQGPAERIANSANEG